MPLITVKLKWGKQEFDVPLDTSDSVVAFKTAVRGLTGVPLERQKLMAKGAWPATLKDEAVLATMDIKEGHAVMLMGTADAVPAALPVVR